jgi:2'-5' RNA ligase
MLIPEAEKWRLFVALEVPEKVREGLAAIQRELQARGLGHLRWVRPEGVHITLKFLGETPAGRVEEIGRALAPVAVAYPPLALRLGRLGTFGDRKGPRVLWVSLEGDVERLSLLQRRVEDALASLRFEREARPFSPHITLARVPLTVVGSSAGNVRAAVAAVKVPPLEMRIDQVSLMRSHLGPGGARYEQVMAFPLEGMR